MQTQAARVEGEIRSWSEQYRRAVEAHARALAAAAVRARAAQRRRARHQAAQLERRAGDALHAVAFAEEVRAEETSTGELSCILYYNICYPPSCYRRARKTSCCL